MSKVLGTICVLLFIILTPVAIRADPVIVSSGFLSVTGISGGPLFAFAGEGFSVSGGGEAGFSAPQSCLPCISGALISLNSLFVGTSLGQGTAIINGVTFNDHFLAGSIQFTGSSIVLPAVSSGITLSAPFTFSGSMIGCIEPHVNCSSLVAVFSTELTGQGIATVQFNFVSLTDTGQSLYTFNNIRYDFVSEPIPEPTTILLLGGGLAGLSLTLRKRRTCEL